MMKRKKILALGLITLLFLSAGCKEPNENGNNSQSDNGDSQGNNNNSQPKTGLFEDLSELEAYLAASKLNTKDNPIPIKVNIYLPSAWPVLIEVLFNAGRYVDLDISDSTGITTFDPGTADTGEHLIVSLVLPKIAINIKDGNDNSSSAFGKFSALKKVSGNNIETIGSYCFSNRATLETVNFPVLVTIGGSAFYGCTGLTNITIPNSVTAIGGSVFYGCTGLTNITIPNSVTYIAQDAFRGCTGLTGITIPASVTFIGSDLVYNYESGVFSGCTSLATVTFMAGSQLQQINATTFNGCTSLASITIPASVTTIGELAFQGCTGLTNITIPDSVTTIGWGAFYGCTGLKTVVFNGSPSLVNSAFQGNLDNVYTGQGKYTTANPGNDAVWTKVE
jgi:hypothetical protein